MNLIPKSEAHKELTEEQKKAQEEEEKKKKKREERKNKKRLKEMLGRNHFFQSLF